MPIIMTTLSQCVPDEDRSMDAAIVSKELLTRFDDNLVQSGILGSSQLASFEDNLYQLS